MKFVSSFIFLLVFLFVFSCGLFAEQETINTWKCKDWEKVTSQVEKAPLKEPVVKKYKPIPQKIKDIEPQQVQNKSEKKNMILLQPWLMFAYSKHYRTPAVIPGVTVGYLRQVNDNFNFGFGALYGHAFYQKSFNAVGGSLIFGFKF
jgi:hypothetical protein